jgi:hypothetical protein
LNQILMNTQQAPPLVQASRESPAQSALMNAQPTSGGTSHRIKAAARIVSATLVQVENRLWYIQPTMPTSLRGGGRSAWRSVLTSATIAYCPLFAAHCRTSRFDKLSVRMWCFGATSRTSW